ncbi:hypothetical protein PanWU01x14_017880, partial [Parasponia andersonii]
VGAVASKFIAATLKWKNNKWRQNATASVRQDTATALDRKYRNYQRLMVGAVESCDRGASLWLIARGFWVTFLNGNYP